MAPGEFVFFGPQHLAYLAGVVAVWAVVLIWGQARLTPAQRRWVVFALVAASLGQEIFDDILRASFGRWLLEEHAPLHLCSFALFASVYALLSRKQFGFEVAYYWALAACTQALLTPDYTTWTFTFFDGRLNFDALWTFVSHGLFILNVLWLVVVEGMRCRHGSWFRVFLFTNMMLIPVALANWVIGPDANYFFLSRKPGGDSPFLVGDWPYYLLSFEALGILFFWLLYLPMGYAGREKHVG